ncbi:putative proto-oncogene tyrosine-protein kinase receptor Ret-like [Apostichopus japonicus]|uniref:Putative proto-oncogene tyrosine-protein kinase receptor Ret-like n=1 Tax=Stichopus japonicus TaxID=307972 RepID=A0A2G8KZJ1_STIJA|nr:putative proto-oncogene tyrosine-protein kinase receptor Ret-like [Apostichopus japonicus]
MIPQTEKLRSHVRSCRLPGQDARHIICDYINIVDPDDDRDQNDEVLNAVIEESLLEVQDTSDQPSLDACLQESLENFQQAKMEAPMIVVVQRRRSAIDATKSADFSFLKEPKVLFSGEEADDLGGPKGEFFRCKAAIDQLQEGLGSVGGLWVLCKAQSRPYKKLFVSGISSPLTYMGMKKLCKINWVDGAIRIVEKEEEETRFTAGNSFYHNVKGNGKVSKVMLDNINQEIRNTIEVNQWRSTSTITEWFKSLKDKHHRTFMIFDIVDFYPPITEKLLTDALNWAKTYVNISAIDHTVIMHARKSIFFSDANPWTKKDS